MYTTVKTKDESGNEVELNFITHDYSAVGAIYLIINNDVRTQQALQTTEEKYHKKLRKKVEKAGDTWTGTEI